MSLSMSASDDIEKSVEASLEEFVNQANAAFAEDFDGWDIAQTTAEVRFFMEGKKQQEEAAKQAQEAIKLQQAKPVAVVAAGVPAAESTAIVKPLPTPGGGQPAARPRPGVETRRVGHEDLTVPTSKLPVEEADKTVPQPKVASPGMSKGFLFATMLGAFLVGAAVVLLVVKFVFMAPQPPSEVVRITPTPAPVAAPASAPAEPAAAPAKPAAVEPAPAAPAPAAVAEKEPPAAPTPAVTPPKPAAPKAAAPKPAAPKAAAAKPAAARPAVAKPAPKPAAPAKPKKKTKGAGELIDVF